MRRFCLPLIAFTLLAGLTGPTRADALKDDLMALNARWDAAINGPDLDALLPMYAEDAELMPPGTRPVTGPAAIRGYFAALGRTVRDHHLQFVSALTFGNYAYATSRFTANFVKEGSEPLKVSGSTVRLFEHQADGSWKIKSHMFLRE